MVPPARLPRRQLPVPLPPAPSRARLPRLQVSCDHGGACSCAGHALQRTRPSLLRLPSGEPSPAFCAVAVITLVKPLLLLMLAGPPTMLWCLPAAVAHAFVVQPSKVAVLKQIFVPVRGAGLMHYRPTQRRQGAWEDTMLSATGRLLCGWSGLLPQACALAQSPSFPASCPPLSATQALVKAVCLVPESAASAMALAFRQGCLSMQVCAFQRMATLAHLDHAIHLLSFSRSPTPTSPSVPPALTLCSPRVAFASPCQTSCMPSDFAMAAAAALSQAITQCGCQVPAVALAHVRGRHRPAMHSACQPLGGTPCHSACPCKPTKTAHGHMACRCRQGLMRPGPMPPRLLAGHGPGGTRPGPQLPGSDGNGKPGIAGPCCCLTGGRGQSAGRQSAGTAGAN